MPQHFLAKVARFFEGNPAVNKVADDSALAAELILLLRLIFVDGHGTSSEIARFRAIVGQAFGIGDDDMAAVMQYIRDFAYETDEEQAATLFAEMAPERKTMLLRHLLAIGEADHALGVKEIDFIRRTANILGVTPENLRRDAGR